MEHGFIKHGFLEKKGFDFSLMILRFIEKLPRKPGVWTISDQLVRSGTSIGANIIEAKASSSRLEFKRFHEIALRSANETEYWLLLLLELNVIDKKEVEILLNCAHELSKLLSASILKLKAPK
ncbi:MAG: S23 ribosomal protein [Parcubacteria group bacterium Gr01-1014_18]|nr:MAG: S23 ribosomal protein [Parcubacteria group bacterium Greene0416_36]TSC80022.1 MAG: S23 ribosomal protein [Parcubacteria group bacterium Gr01-1014_18]TSC98110.1 MAG: S23 ribosomal protein [Parcubacteria group bacterium Greene1014_20]TSD06626.1 MAG: S23 ribosomal protein [Parcubacteria group bacterium Greene0714_2]